MKRLFKWLLFPVLAVTIGFMACGKDNPIVDPPPAGSTAVLRVSQDSLALRGGNDEIRLFLFNTGTGQLDWSVASKPSWLSVSKTSGSVMSGRFQLDTLLLVTQTDLMAPGDYTGTLSIVSNGGNKNIPVSMIHGTPEFKVWLPLLTLSREFNSTSVQLFNRGGDVVKWKVTSKPDWIALSADSGSVREEESLNVMVVLDGLEYTTHIDTIRIESNAGNQEVQVFLYNERLVEVIPGATLGKISLGTSFGTIIQTYGTPPVTTYEQLGPTLLHYRVDYQNEGLQFEFTVNHMLNVLDPVERITADAPFSGVTEEGVGIGSQLLKVVNTYGPPVRIDAARRLYVYTGISYEYGADSTFVEKIHIPE
jgi:hypothetical protein